MLLQELLTDYETFIQECKVSQNLLAEFRIYCIAYCQPEIKLELHQKNVGVGHNTSIMERCKQ